MHEKSLLDLKVKIFADGADKASMLDLYRRSYIRGFTTNPTLMRKAGVVDYREFAREVLAVITDRPISFEVFTDTAEEMIQQGREIASWGENVYVKIPVTNTHGVFMGEVIRTLAADRVKLNVTAVMTLEQTREIAACLSHDVPSIVSIFAGRIADSGRDPLPIMREAVEILRPLPHAELIWASPRELLNIFHAEQAGCHIITVTDDIMKKLPLIGKDLDLFSLETVRMFHGDAEAAGFSL